MADKKAATDKVKASPCCSCNGPNAKYKSCKCVKSRRLCTNCFPARCGGCSNLSTPDSTMPIHLHSNQRTDAGTGVSAPSDGPPKTSTNLWCPQSLLQTELNSSPSSFHALQLESQPPTVLSQSHSQQSPFIKSPHVLAQSLTVTTQTSPENTNDTLPSFERMSSSSFIWNESINGEQFIQLFNSIYSLKLYIGSTIYLFLHMEKWASNLSMSYQSFFWPMVRTQHLNLLLLKRLWFFHLYFFRNLFQHLNLNNT